MAKSEPGPVGFRELLPIKSSCAVVNTANHCNKEVIVHVPEPLTLQDLVDDGKLFRLIQQDRNKALSEDDRVELRWSNMRAYTAVDYADAGEVRFLKPDVKHRSERDRTPWQDQNYEVRPVQGGWCYFRKKDGVRMTSALFPTWESAKQACIRDQAGVRVA